MTVIVLGLASGAVIGLIAVGIVLVYKATRVLNFAQAEIATFAAYVSWFLVDRGARTGDPGLLGGWPWPLGWLAAIAVAALIGMAFERFVTRPMGDADKTSLSVATIGLLFLLTAIEIWAWGTSPRLLNSPLPGSGITLFGFVLTPLRLVAFATLAALAIGLAVLVRRTRMGLALLAVAEDPATAQLMGVPYHRVAAATWGAAGALGGIAGLINAPLSGGVSPSGLTVDLFVPGLTAALLGGLTSLPGAFVGGMAIGIVQAELKIHLGGVIGISSYGMLVVILLVLLLRPRGLFGKAA